MELDTTSVANAYMRVLEEQLRVMIVNNSLLQAKLNTALEQLQAYSGTKPVSAGFLKRCEDCDCTVECEKDM